MSTPPWQPVPDATARRNIERSDKLESTAIDILKLAVEATKGQTLTASDLAAFAEVLWQWTTTDTWPPPQ